MHPALPVIVMLFGSMLWGLTWIPLKYFNSEGIEVIPVVFMTNLAVSILLLPWLIKQYPLWKSRRNAIFLIVILSGITNLSFAAAMIYGDVIRVMVLFYLLPAWGVLGGRFFLKELITKTRWAALVLALLGAFLVLDGIHFFQASATWVDALALLAGFALAMNNVVFRATPDLPDASKISAVFLGSLLLSSVLLLLNFQSLPPLSNDIWIYTMLFGLFWILIATLSTQWAVTKLEVGRSSILIIMELATAVVSAMWIGGERATQNEIIGGILIVVAAVIETRRVSNTN